MADDNNDIKENIDGDKSDLETLKIQILLRKNRKKSVQKKKLKNWKILS